MYPPGEREYPHAKKAMEENFRLHEVREAAVGDTAHKFQSL